MFVYKVIKKITIRLRPELIYLSVSVLTIRSTDKPASSPMCSSVSRKHAPLQNA